MANANHNQKMTNQAMKAARQCLGLSRRVHKPHSMGERYVRPDQKHFLARPKSK
jgi:hypothetical protein